MLTLLLLLSLQDNDALRRDIAAAQSTDPARYQALSREYVRGNLGEVTGLLKQHLERDVAEFAFRDVRVRVPLPIFRGGTIQSVRLADDVKLGTLRPTSNAAGSVGVPLVVEIVDPIDSVAGRVNERVVRTIPVTVTLEKGANFVTIHDPRRTTEVSIGGTARPLARNLAAPIALAADRVKTSGIAETGVKDPKAVLDRAGIYFVEPYDGAKDVLLLTHGLFRSPYIWADLVNRVATDPALSSKYQVAVAYYPTGLDPNVAAKLLVEDLARDQKVLGFQRVEMVGHSLGGVLTKLATSKPELADQLPFVKRAVFVAAPLEGSPVSRILDVPLLGWFAKRRTGSAASIRALDPDGEFMRELKSLEPRVEHHVIAADRIRWFREWSYMFNQVFFGGRTNDGMVGLDSALSPKNAASKVVVPESHFGIVGSEGLFRELRRILVGSPAMSTARREAAGAGHFALAYVVKEAMNGRVAVGELAKPQFWGDLAVFTVAARATRRLPAAFPLAAGMAAVQLLHGPFSSRDLAIDTASFLAAGAVVSFIADGLIYPALFAAGPPGWIAAGAYSVAKLAVTLYAGEKLGDWWRGRLQRDHRSGITDKLNRLGIQSPR